MKTKNSFPLVSILVPVYNGSAYLEEMMASIRQNSHPKYEVILVNDGSTDESRKMCQKFAKNDSRVFFYDFTKNRGLDRVLNFGIKKAKGKYVARLNQDDLLLPDRLEKQVRFLENNPDYVVVGGQIVLFNEKKEMIDRVYFPLSDKKIRAKWLILSPYSDPAVMYRKKAILKTNGYSQNFWPADDVQMWYQLGRLGRLANLPNLVTKVRWHKNCGSIKFHRIQIKKTWEVHQWAAKNIQKPNLGIYLFWLGQSLAGCLFPPQFNWFVYRQVKRFQEFNLSQILGKIFKPIKKVNKVIPQPITASLSGV